MLHVQIVSASTNRSSVHLSVYLKLFIRIGLVQTCTKYGYMQANTKDMYEKEELIPNDMIFQSQDSRLAKLGLGKLVSFQDLD